MGLWRGSDWRSAALGCVAIVALAACGSSSSKSTTTGGSPGTSSTTTATAQPVPLALSVVEHGKIASLTAPATIQGGVVTATLTNSGKAPHSAQFFLLDSNHTTSQLLRLLMGNSNKQPSWLHLVGGVAPVGPGETGSATVQLDAGHYVVAELPNGPGGGGPPPHTDLTVSAGAGAGAALPTTAATVTAANPSKDHYSWQVSGPLHPGVNHITFASKGKKTTHVIVAARIKGNPSHAEILKALASNGPPPPFADQSTLTNTAAIDGGRSEVTDLKFTKPGRYLLFCPLTDSDGGKEHFKEGLLKIVTVS